MPKEPAPSLAPPSEQTMMVWSLAKSVRSWSTHEKVTLRRSRFSHGGRLSMCLCHCVLGDSACGAGMGGGGSSDKRIYRVRI